MLAAINVTKNNTLQLPLEIAKNLPCYELALINYALCFSKTEHGKPVALTCNSINTNQYVFGFHQPVLYILQASMTRKFIDVPKPIYIKLRGSTTATTNGELYFSFVNEEQQEIKATGSRSHILIHLRKTVDARLTD